MGFADTTVTIDVEVVPDLEDLLLNNNAAAAADDLMMGSFDDDDQLIGGSFMSASAFSHEDLRLSEASNSLPQVQEVI